jgi:hypothetical protein
MKPISNLQELAGFAVIIAGLFARTEFTGEFPNQHASKENVH